MASAVESMQKLVWRVRYNAFHYLQMLKKLMPLGPIWHFPLFDVTAAQPDWVYLDTWYYDDYETGVFTPGYDPQWGSLATIITAAGQRVAVSVNGAQESYNYFNTGHPIKGDFELEAELQLKDAGWDTGSGVWTALQVYDSVGLAAYVYWQENTGVVGCLFFKTPVDSDTVSYPWGASKSCRVKMKRVGGVFDFYYDIGSGWQQFSCAGTWSADVRIVAQLEDKTPGYGYVKLQADEGLPIPVIDFSLHAVWARLLSCFATELEELEKRVTALLTEMVPALSSELLTDWEEVAGLPDECSALGATEEERQNTVHEKITAQYAYMGEQFYIDYAAALGVTITIEVCGAAVEAARCGIGRCGVARCANLDTMFWWRVTLPTGHPMNSTIECLFLKMKPAETYLCFAYV